NCSHRSIHGPVICNWKRDGDTVAVELRVPVNTSAVLNLSGATSITENGQPAEKSNGVKKLASPEGGVKLQLESGSYTLRVTL
ncbi:MAG: alpha-L-rhamnosidase C-terminal domain-containing protein, partial [Lentimonas sp.]